MEVFFETHVCNGIEDIGNEHGNIINEYLLRRAVRETTINAIDILYIIKRLQSIYKQGQEFKVFIHFRERGVDIFSNMEDFQDQIQLVRESKAVLIIECRMNEQEEAPHLIMADITKEALTDMRNGHYPVIDLNWNFATNRARKEVGL